MPRMAPMCGAHIRLCVLARHLCSHPCQPPTETTAAPHDDDDEDDDIDNCSEDSVDEDLRAWYDGEWARRDDVPYVSAGLPAFIDSEEELEDKGPDQQKKVEARNIFSPYPVSKMQRMVRR